MVIIKQLDLDYNFAYQRVKSMKDIFSLKKDHSEEAKKKHGILGPKVGG